MTIHLPFGVTLRIGEPRGMTMGEARIWLARKTYTDCLAARRAQDITDAAVISDLQPGYPGPSHGWNRVYPASNAERNRDEAGE